MKPSRRSRLWDPGFPFRPASITFFYGWVIVAAATIGMIFTIPGQTMGFSVFTDILIVELGLSRLQLSTAYLVGTVLSGFSLPWLGRVFDRIGARRMAVYASVATGLVLFYLSACTRISAALTAIIGPTGIATVAVPFLVITIGFYLIRASAQGVLALTGRNMIGKWFDYHRGTALALSGVFTGFAFSIAPRVLDMLIRRFGYDGTWGLLGVITLIGMGGLGWLLYRDNPEQCGLRMDGPEAAGRKRIFHADAIAHRDYSLAEAVRTLPFWAFILSFAFYSLFGTAITFHIVSLGAEAGIDRTTVIGYFVPMAFFSVGTNLFCGWISSRTRLKYLLFAMNLAAIASVVGALNLAEGWGPALFVAGNGVCGGAFVALAGISTPRFFGRRHIGAISGVGMSSMVIASGIGPFVFSLSTSTTGSYRAALWISLLIPAFLALLATRSDNPQRRD
ncbi:MAG: MFS transporter [Opitutaceae bacterium]